MSHHIKKKRGTFASRAHSFKENFLEALKQSSQQHTAASTPNGRRTSGGGRQHHEKKAIHLAKKAAGSSDNLMGHLGTAKNTDCLVKEVQFALKYFQDVVAKQTHEMLPGCATVVLETVLAIQAFAGSIEDPIDPEVRAALDMAFKAVSALTTWADNVIVNGEVGDDAVSPEDIVEPVRKSVIVVVNLLTVRIGRQKMGGRGNSLPDITSDITDSEAAAGLLMVDAAGAGPHHHHHHHLSQSSDSILDLSSPPHHSSSKSSPPALLPRFSLTSSSGRTSESTVVAPPLPPKHLKPRLNRRLEELICRSYSFHHQGDWLLQAYADQFEAAAAAAAAASSAFDPLYYNNSGHNYQGFDKSLPSPGGSGLETTFLDQSFDCDANGGSPGSLSVHNMSTEDEVDCQPPFKANFNVFSRSWSARERSNASSPSLESFGSHFSDSADQQQQVMPPALPKKSRDAVRTGGMLHKSHSNTATRSEVFQLQPPPLGCRSNKSSTPSTTASIARRKLSEYDNVPETSSRAIDLMNKLSLYGTAYEQQHQPLQLTKSDSFYEPPLRAGGRYAGGRTSTPSSTTTWSKIAESRRASQDRPPPLPPKKRNVMSYMEMFGRTVLPSGEDLLQGFYHTHDLLHNVWQQNLHAYTDYTSSPVNLFQFPFIDAAENNNDGGDALFDASSHRLQSYVNFNPTGGRQKSRHSNVYHNFVTPAPCLDDDRPPALPPKRSSRSRPGSFRSSSSGCDYERRIPILRDESAAAAPTYSSRLSQLSDQSSSSGSSCEPAMPRLAEITKLPRLSVAIPIEIVSQCAAGGGSRSSPATPVKITPKAEDDAVILPGGEIANKENAAVLVPTLLDSLNVSEHLVYGSLPPMTAAADHPSGVGELRAGSLEALIVLATQTIKNDFLYQEAFLTTYRTFLTTEALVDKLVYRYRRFSARRTKSGGGGGDSAGDSVHRRASRAAFSLLVRVVDGLADMDFQDRVLLAKLTQFITSLIEAGSLGLARALRSQFILKYEERRTRLLPDFDLAAMNSINRRCILLNFKSTDLAEQMTLLDSNLFLRIDSAELLIWVQEQSEEKCPNLTKFTEHFNNMSYWTRTLILNQPDGKERERYVMKFIKIMKCLRKMNNFNSYLAILSALDSAPIRRLEWQKNVTDGLKEYCALIDSSSSFRAYRSALAEACPPCIPYIGLVLQDLTFVHIGNPDTIEDKINFAKRWQQFNILDNLRRFKKEQYHIARQEEILQFFGEFEDYLTEDEMWSLSETIKPRGQPNKGLK